MNKKAQLIDQKMISLAIGILIILIVGPLLLKFLFSGFKSPNIEDIIFPLLMMVIFFEFIRRLLKW